MCPLSKWHQSGNLVSTNHRSLLSLSSELAKLHQATSGACQGAKWAACDCPCNLPPRSHPLIFLGCDPTASGRFTACPIGCHFACLSSRPFPPSFKSHPGRQPSTSHRLRICRPTATAGGNVNFTRDDGHAQRLRYQRHLHLNGSYPVQICSHLIAPSWRNLLPLHLATTLIQPSCLQVILSMPPSA